MGGYGDDKAPTKRWTEEPEGLIISFILPSHFLQSQRNAWQLLSVSILFYPTDVYWGRVVAQALMDELVHYAHERDSLSLSAKVASDLSGANAFYEQMGFHTVSTLPGGKTRNRLPYHRVRDLDTPSLFDLMGPKGQGRLLSLEISGKYSSKTPIYAIDLNVLFDVSKKRVRSEDAGMVISAALSGDIRLVIAEE